LKTVLFGPGKVRSLSVYLEYFFLRFPGTLDPEESWELECLDTYDRLWTRRNQLWVRRSGRTCLVSPPSLFSENDDLKASFGFQAPLTLGKVTAKVRSLAFATDRSVLQGQLVKVRGRSYLVLRGKDDALLKAVENALLADGLEPVVPGSLRMVADRAPAFEGPKAFSTPLGSDSAASFLIERVADELRVGRQYERGIAEDIDTECLHQYRVHVRRARSLVSLGLQWQTLPEWARLKTVLKALQQTTNELRDLDVLLLDFPELANLLPWDEGERLSGWENLLRLRRTAQWRRIRKGMSSEANRFVWAEIPALLSDLSGLGVPWSVSDLATSAFGRSARKLRRSLKGLGPQSPDGALHEVRIRTKELRYALDGLGFLGPPAVTKTLSAALRQTQEGLGLFQDRSVLLDRLKAEREAFRSGKVGADALSFGILLGALAAEHRAQKHRALADCQKLQSRSFLKALKTLDPQPQEADDEPRD